MRSYTVRDLCMNVCGTKYGLPDELQQELKRDPQLETVKNLFLNKKVSSLEIDKEVVIDEKWGRIVLPCLYQGYDGYYRYFINIDVFQLSEGPYSGKYMIALFIESEHGELLHELVDIQVMPNIISDLGLQKWNYLSYA